MASFHEMKAFYWNPWNAHKQRKASRENCKECQGNDSLEFNFN